MPWILLAVIGSVAAWVAVSFMIASLSGWRELAEKFAAEQLSPTPRRHSGGRVGGVTYGGALKLGALPNGFLLSVLLPFRLGHRPLAMQWSDVSESGGEFMGAKTIVLRVRAIGNATIELPVAAVEWLKSSSAAASAKTPN